MPPSPAPPPVQWTDWPARRQPARAALATALILATVAAVGAQDRWLALLAALLLLLATGEALLPTRYRLDAQGASLRSPFRAASLPWDRLAAIEERPAGPWLRARGSRPWLVRRRSLQLRGVPGDARDFLARIRS